MQLKHIEYFVKTSEYQSFNEAAKHLFITQPSLSAAIATLERELGYALFSRSKKGIVLTPEGEEILPDAKKMLETYKKWIGLAKQPVRMEGSIHITAPGVICSTIVLDMLLTAADRYPALRFTIKDDSPNLSGLTELSHTLCLAMDFCMPSEIDSLQKNAVAAKFNFATIASASSLVFLNSAHPLAKEKELTLEQLEDFAFVTYEKYTKLPYAKFYSRFSRNKIKELPTREMMFDFIAKNANYAGIFSSICLYTCQPYKDGAICVKTIQEHPMPVNVVLLSPISQEKSPLLSVVRDLLEESCRKFDRLQV